MSTSTARAFLITATTVVLLVGWGQQAWSQGQRAEATDGAALVRGLDAELDSALTPLDRQILEMVNESQLEELLDGVDPAFIYLSNGETLADLAARTQAESSRNLLFAPLRPCRLFDTRLTAEGPVRTGETRGFRVREAGDGYATQGGSVEGCGLPGLDGLTLKTNVVRAVALNVQTMDAGGPGSLAVWPANRSEPEIGSVSYLSGLAGGLLVPVCDEAGIDPCRAGDLKIKAKVSGAHVVAEVVGYFHTAGASLAQLSEPADEEATDDEAEEPVRREVAAAESSSLSPQPLVLPPTQSMVDPQSEDGLPSITPTPAGVEPPYPNLAPNPLGGNAKIRAVVGTGEGTSGGGNYQSAITAHLQNDEGIFYLSAIKSYATTGNAVYAFTPSGGRSFYGQTQDGYAFYGFDGGSNPNRGYAGYFYSTNGIGVYGYSNANRSHPNIYAPAVYAQSNQGVGVYGRGDTSNTHSFFNEGGRFEGGKGLYALGTDPVGEGGYGAQIFSSQYRGMYVQGATNFYDAYFGGNTGISAADVIDRGGSFTVLAANVGGSAIEAGDLVALAGVVPSPEHGRPILGVARVDASNRQAVVGVAGGAHAATVVTSPEAGERVDFAPVEGAAAPGGYLAVITQGLAPAVKLGGASSGWRVGERVEISAGGAMQRVSGEAESVSIGRVASAPDPQTGTVAIFVDID